MRLIGLASQMGITIYLGAYFGKMLDEKYPSNKKWFTFSLTLIALCLALYNVLQQLKKIDSESEND